MTRFRRIFTVLVFSALVLLFATPAWPTARSPRRSSMRERKGSFSRTAGVVFTRDNPRPEFAAPHTACWRGYIDRGRSGRAPCTSPISRRG